MAVKFSQFSSASPTATTFLVGYDGAVNIKVPYSSLVGGSGTLNYLPKWTSSTALGNSLVFDNGTSVGVNTATPNASYRLDVVGAGNFSGGVNVTGSGTLINEFRSSGLIGIDLTTDLSSDWHLRLLATNNTTQSISASGSMQIYSNGNTSVGSGNNLIFQTNGTANERARFFQSTGNLSIGYGGSPTDAGFRLDVSGTFRSTGDANINGLTVGKGGGNLDGNTIIGSAALTATNTGGGNTAVGYQVFQSATTGYSNTAIGTQSLRVATSGYENTAVGRASLLALTSGNSNVAIGKDAGLNATTGASNTFIGTGTGAGITTGSFNTIIGAFVTGLSSSLSNTIILADGQGNQRLYINSSGNVGIGTTSPSARLDVTASNNEIRSTGTASTYTQYNAFIPSGVNMRIGAFATNNGYLGTTTNHPFTIETNNTERARFFANGNVAIGTTTDGGYRLDVNGTARVSGTELRLDNGTTGTINLYSTTPEIRFFAGDPTGYRLYRSGTSMVWNSGGSINLNISGNDAYGVTAALGHIWRTANTGGAALARLDTGGSLSIGNGTTAANASSILDLTSTTKGFLPPRMTNAQMTAIATPASGLTVYDTTNNKLNYYNGTAWVAL